MPIEAPRTRHELDLLFAAACRSPETSSIADLDALSRGVALLGVFSDNEEFDDVDARDVGLALADYWLGGAVLRKPAALPLNPVLRQAQVRQSQAHFDRFLLRCTKLGLFPLEGLSSSSSKRGGEEEDEQQKQYLVQVSSREDKIARFQRAKQLKQELAQLESSRGGEEERDVWRTRLLLACVDTLDEFDGVARELQVLEFMIAQQPASASASAPPPPSNKPIQVTRVGADFELKKETFHEGVFRPYHRQPTVTLEQFADSEMQRMAEQEAARVQRAVDDAILFNTSGSNSSYNSNHNNSNKPAQSLSELYELGEEDDARKMDRAIDKARKWDDWKDGTPKGSGVTKRL